MNDGRVTAVEMAKALARLAPAMQQAWQMYINDESLWRQRENLYRETFILGQFHWYRRLRVWWLRRAIRKEQER